MVPLVTICSCCQVMNALLFLLDGACDEDIITISNKFEEEILSSITSGGSDGDDVAVTSSWSEDDHLDRLVAALKKHPT